ncbi:MAG: hypothetical protein GWN76_14670, partial [candidate division Zixibacteria bacterium]|nr:hypothetical protein [candidate division Zixibacteria bacterium]NIR65384.1 hypothetical protein [candidate division Zixibacteria bacterium]NIS47078.1 hypothetical protein [candidate division Zixibacteria bacterium]NIU15214.1 hypothetical protein [candidate division Zixibacteria bacterium]
MKRVSWFVLTAFVFVIWAFVGSVHGAVIEESVTLEWEQEMIEDLQPDGGWAVYWGDTPDGPFTRFETSPGVPLFWSVDSVTVITGDPIRY